MFNSSAFRIALAFLCVFFILAISLPGCSSSQAVGSTSITRLEGDVQVLKAGQSEWSQAQLQMVLNPGDSLKTGVDSLAVVTFFEGTTIELKPGTQIQISELVQALKKGDSTTIRLRQEMGETLNTITKLADTASRYEVETPVALAGVRGSQMIVKVAAGGRTVVQNLEGLIFVVAQGQEVNIPVGHESTVEPGQPPGIPVPVIATPVNTPSPSVRVNTDPENDVFNSTGQPVNGYDYLDIVGESIERTADYWIVSIYLKGNIPDMVDSTGVVEWDVMVDADSTSGTGWQSAQLFNDLGIDYYLSVSRKGSNLGVAAQRVTQSTEPYSPGLDYRASGNKVSIWFNTNAIGNSTKFNFMVLARQYARSGDPQSLVAFDKIPETAHYGISTGGS